MGRKKKIVRHVIPAIGLLVVLLALLNLYLTNRLERYLKEELSSRTTTATDGFYILTYDDLSVSFFKGELKIEGIRLTPDSTVFRRWAAIDSLPHTYATARIGMIDFKGLNLTWRWNYKKLHFNSFEIKDPDIEIFYSYYSGRTGTETKHAESKSLYEVISPYINVLSVRTLNLSHASVSYTVENPTTPIVYALTDVSFRAYGFLLDQYSFESGKLLYCDDFEFITNQPQTLLVNNDFRLTTDSIKLSTHDSVIYIEKIHLFPQQALWTETNQHPASYLSALVETVEVKGIQFERKEALNYLTARSFDILSSELEVFNQVTDSTTKESLDTDTTSMGAKFTADSLVQALSLYQIISPVLHRVSIRTIGIDDTRVTYRQTVRESVEVYKLDNFSFRADSFLVDSVSESGHGIWYSRNFAFDATGITGLMTARNHRFVVDRLALNTATGDFSIENVHLFPLSTRTRNDYLSGSVDTIKIKGLLYDKGISARLFKIDRPNIHYYKAPLYGKKSKEVPVGLDPKVDVAGVLNPLLRYLSIERIELNRASFALHDRSISDPVTYQLKNFHFFATHFLVNDSTNRRKGLFFGYNDMGFRFTNFDNYLPGKDYRLSVGRGQYSTLSGALQLHEVRLLPQDTTWKNAPGMYGSLTTPLICVDGLKRLPEYLIRGLKAGSLRIESPDIQFRKSDGSHGRLILNELSLSAISWDSTHLSLGQIDLAGPSIDYQAGSPSATLEKESEKEVVKDIYAIFRKITPLFSLDKFRVTNASLRGDTASLLVEGLQINSAEKRFQLDNVQFNTGNLAIPIDDGYYTLRIGKVDLDNTNLSVERVHLESAYPQMEFAYRQPQHKDWFDVKVGSLRLKEIDYPAWFSEKTLRIGQVEVDNAELRNFKNQKIIVPHRMVPMIYSRLQKAPVKVDIGNLEVNNLSVVYEELARKGISPGKLFFTEMNGKFAGFTNIVGRPDQYIRLDANGKLMGKGYFTATWMLPVDSLNDRFLLNARMNDFDLTHLNGLLEPLAFVRVESGRLNDFSFDTQASSKGASVNMRFLYSELKAEIMKEKKGEVVDNKFLSRLVNLVLKHDNPDRRGKGDALPRQPHITIERDPYHSTFNYIWQILRPALAESVGVPEKAQHVAKKVTGFFGKIKNFFHPPKKQETMYK